MEYMLYASIFLFGLLLVAIIRKTVARHLFEHLYVRALKKGANKTNCYLWGRLYYTSYSRRELKEDGIPDIKIAIEEDINSHRLQVN